MRPHWLSVWILPNEDTSSTVVVAMNQKIAYCFTQYLVPQTDRRAVFQVELVWQPFLPEGNQAVVCFNQICGNREAIIIPVLVHPLK